MVFTIFAEDKYGCVIEYTVTMNASYSEIEEASKRENFISWVVANATDIDMTQLSDWSSNDMSETIVWLGNKKLATFYNVFGDEAKLLPQPNEDD